MTVALPRCVTSTPDYGKLEIPEGVSSTVQSGQVVSIIGPNGRGKSTVSRPSSASCPPGRGRVTLRRRRMSRISLPPISCVAAMCTSRRPHVFPLMTVEENLRLGAYTRPRSPELEDESSGSTETFPVLRRVRRRRAGDLSGGQQQDAGDGRALALKPRLILLDEPTAGLAPLASRRSFRMSRTSGGSADDSHGSSRTPPRRWEISTTLRAGAGLNRYEGAGDVIRKRARTPALPGAVSGVECSIGGAMGWFVAGSSCTARSPRRGADRRAAGHPGAGPGRARARRWRGRPPPSWRRSSPGAPGAIFRSATPSAGTGTTYRADRAGRVQGEPPAPAAAATS